MTVDTPTVQNQVLRLISQIQCEDIRRQRESRSTNRQNLTLPVTIQFLKDNRVVNAVSRDLSSLGIGLITTEQLPTDCVCELELELESSRSYVLAKCTWCRPFGNGFYLTGWTFQNS